MHIKHYTLNIYKTYKRYNEYFLDARESIFLPTLEYVITYIRFMNDHLFSSRLKQNNRKMEVITL